MPPNPFDQFDAASPPANAFDQFDAGTKRDQYGAWESAGEGFLKGASANWRDEIYGASRASGLPEALGGLRAPIGAARLAYESLTEPKSITSLVTGRDERPAHREYERARDDMRRREEDMQREHPIAFGTGEFGGAVAGMTGTGAVARAAGLAAPAAATVAGRIGQAAAGGAGYGAVAGAGEARDTSDLAERTAGGAATGGAFGALGGGLAEAVTPIASRAANAVRGIRDPEGEASRRVAHAATADRQRGPSMSPDEEAEAAAAGTPRVLGDEGERSRALARSAANTSPEAREALTQVTADRFQSQSPRISTFVRGLTGGGHASDQLEALQTQARAANRPAYDAAYRAGEDGVWSPTLERLTSAPAVRRAMQDAVQRGGNRAVAEGYGGFNPGVTFGDDGIMRFGQGRGAPPYPTAQFWDYVQRELRDTAGAASRAGRNEEASAVNGLRRSLLSELDAANPAFGQARRGAAQFFGAEDALEAGQNFVASSASIPEARRALAAMSAPERELFARGYGSRLADEIEKRGFNQNVLNGTFVNNTAARERMRMALGPQRAGRLEALLRAEAVVDRLRTALGNSTTARQLMEMGLAGGATAGVEGLVTHDMDPRNLAFGAVLGMGLRMGAVRVDERVARRVGEMLASNDPDVLRQGLQLMAQTPAIMTWLRRLTGAAGAGATQGVMNATGPTAPRANSLRPGGLSALSPDDNNTLADALR